PRGPLPPSLPTSLLSPLGDEERKEEEKERTSWALEFPTSIFPTSLLLKLLPPLAVLPTRFSTIFPECRWQLYSELVPPGEGGGAKRYKISSYKNRTPFIVPSRWENN